MNIEAVNSVLVKAIIGFQEGEIEAMAEAMATGRTSYDVKPPKPRIPSPAEMHKKHGMPVPSGTVKSELIGKGKARKGMVIGNAMVVKATPTKVTIAFKSGRDAGSRFRGRAYTYTWDGIGYAKSGNYLHTDGFHKLAGSKPMDPKKIYPEGTVIQSEEKWVWIIAGKGKKEKDFDGTVETKHPIRKLKGRKVGELVVRDRESMTGVHGYVYGLGPSSFGLYGLTVRPPR